jgi:hypothetical protein
MTFGACGTVRAVSEDNPPLPNSNSAVVPVAQPQTVVDGGQLGVQYATQKERPRDLTLSNFFAAGWDDDWAKQERDTGTPNMALLRVQTNFMEREFRMNYYVQNNVNSTTNKTLSDFDALIAWSFNRRFMLEITGAYQWIDPRSGVIQENGGTPGLVGRVQLIDTESSSYSFNLKVVAPNDPLGTDQSTISYGLAGFEDLAYWFDFRRVGLYYSFFFDTLAGPEAAGAKRTDVAYDITLAKTIADPDTPILGNLTLFVENYAQNDTDGAHVGRTLVTITPGVRFNLGKTDLKMGKDNSILIGMDIPVSTYHPWDNLFRLTYIKNF